MLAAPQHGPFQIAKLVEQEQWMIAHAREVPVVGQALLFAMRRAERAIQIQNQLVERSTHLDRVDPGTGQTHQRREILPPTILSMLADASVHACHFLTTTPT